MSSLNFLRMRRGVKTQGNISESPCVGACTLVEKRISKNVEENHRGTHT
jgi:hypothetical protein